MAEFRSIEFTKGFEKQFTKLPPKRKQAFYTRLELFKLDPYAKLLRNHGLDGKYKGYRSIDIQGDLRALYTIRQGKICIFAFVGTHSQLYG